MTQQRFASTTGLASGPGVVHPVTAMNRPVQVTFEPDDRRRARRRAAELGITLAEYIRRLVRDDLESWARDEAAAGGISVDDSGEPLPPRKDVYIGEAVAERIARSDQTRH